MGMVVEEGGPYFHSGLTTCTHSSSQDLTLTPMRMPMPMPTTTSISTITSTRYRLPGTLIASPPPTIISQITITIITIIIRLTIIIIDIIITIIIITTTTTIRFKSISISPEISVIETPVSVCKVTRKSESCFTECSSSFGLIYCALLVYSLTCNLHDAYQHEQVLASSSTIFSMFPRCYTAALSITNLNFLTSGIYYTVI